MKRTLLLFSSLTILASCSTWDDLISRDITDAELPGVPTEINCNPAPTLIYSKAGDIIDRVIPILHPSCDGEVLGETVELERSWWSLFGPPTRDGSTFMTEAQDDDTVSPINVVANRPEETVPATPVEPQPTVTPTEPTAPTEPETPTEPTTPTEPEEPNEPTTPVEPETPVEPVEPEEPKEPEGGCGGAAICEPDSKTEPEAYKKWREEAKKLQSGDS